MTTTTISDIPEEALSQVLVRLAVKDIYTCVSVQKSWGSLIKTNMFKALHSNYHKKITNPRNKKYLLFCDDAYPYKIRGDDIQCEEYQTLNYPPDLKKCFCIQLVSDGLVCLFDIPENETMPPPLHLWNPVIQKYKTLPPPPVLPPSYSDWFWCWAIAFGFVPEINDYVVVYIDKFGLENENKRRNKKKKAHTRCLMTCVYSLSTNSWKKITHDHDSSSTDIVCISPESSVFVNGVAVWVGSNKQRQEVLVCFDTKTEMLRQILLPERVGVKSRVIHAFGQSIAYFVEDDKERFDSQLTMWVLKGDPMNEYLWEKKMMVTLHHDVIVKVLGVRNNGEPILCKNFDLISYDLDGTHQPYDLVKSWNSWAPSFFPDYWDDDKCGPPCHIITPFEESLGLIDVDCTQY